MKNLLGKKVKDKVTGFEGIAVCRCEFLNGCIQYHVSPKAKDNEIKKDEWVDEQQLKVTGDGVAKSIPDAKIVKPVEKTEEEIVDYGGGGGGFRKHPD